MRIVLVERHFSGHHINYVTTYATVLHRLGHSVELMMPVESRETVDAQRRLLDERNIAVHYFSGFPEQHQRGITANRNYLLAKWKFVASAAAFHIRDLDNTVRFFFPYLDTFLGPWVTNAEIERIFPYRWSGLYMAVQNVRVKWKYPGLRRGVLSPHHLLKNKNCAGLAVLADDRTGDVLHRSVRKPVFVFPDVVERDEPDMEFEPIIRALQQAKGRTIVGIVGSLDKRKGILTMVEAARTAEREDLFFLFAGKLNRSSFSESELELISETERTRKGNTFFFLERIPDERKFNAFVSICHILFAAYRQFPYSSNIIGKAALFNRPVIVSKGLYMEEAVQRYGLGLCVQQDDVGEVHRAITQMVSEPYQRRYTEQNMAREYVNDHSIQALTDKFTLLLEVL